MVKLAIVYYSSTGTNYRMALAAEKAAKAEGAEVRLRKAAELAPDAVIDSKPEWRRHVEEAQHVAVASPDDLVWADAFIFGSPTRYGNISSQLKQFIDTTGGVWFEGKISNKVVAGFTSAGTLHGGRESTLLALYNTFYHWGCIIVPPGYTDEVVNKSGGNPYGVSTNPISPDGDISASTKKTVAYMAQRVVRTTAALIKGRA